MSTLLLRRIWWRGFHGRTFTTHLPRASTSTASSWRGPASTGNPANWSNPNLRQGTFPCRNEEKEMASFKHLNRSQPAERGWRKGSYTPPPLQHTLNPGCFPFECFVPFHLRIFLLVSALKPALTRKCVFLLLIYYYYLSKQICL